MSNSVLLPLAGILIGLTFAWGGNAVSLLQTEEMEKLTASKAGGLEDYIYSYQNAVLAILITLVLWGFAGFGIYDTYWPTQRRRLSYELISTSLFFFASLSLRECWQAVLNAHYMLAIRRSYRDHVRR